MSLEPVIVSSETGEVRIEATANKGGETVCFKTYFRNDLLPQLTIDNEPIGNLSIQGVYSYYVMMNEKIRSFLLTKMSSPKATGILGELVKDMAVDVKGI